MIAQSNPLASYTAHRDEIQAAIERVLKSGFYILGAETSAFEQDFASALGASWCVGVANGTDAIELALRACGIGPGDSVLTVSHTAVATISAIARIGAKPLFVDIDPERYTMAPESLLAVLCTESGKAAKAIVVVHIYGQSADIRNIVEIAKTNGLKVVEDCAQAHGAKFDGRSVGTFGDFGCFSFYPTKNLGGLGDGGAVIGGNAETEKPLRLLREYGWKTRYVSETIGFNSRLDELQAAILRAKLPYLAADNQRRQAIAAMYDGALESTDIIRPKRISNCPSVYHQYAVITEDRDDIRRMLSGHGIGTLVHYPLAVHQQPAFSDGTLRPCSLYHTEHVTSRVISLPMFPELSDADIERVCNVLRQIANHK